jgi:autotransporter strand-loop-strand O-heptosyltransferase
MKTRRVLINLGSGALGDTIAWVPQVEEYRKITGYDVVVVSKLGYLFKKSYPKIKFDWNGIPKTTDIYFNIGYGLDDRHKSIPLQQVACMAFNIPYREIKTKIDIPKKFKKRNKKYVCIATHSTAQAKYWNNDQAWQVVVDYLISRGYDVIDIDKNKFNKGNKIPDRVIDKTGDKPLKDRIKMLAGADMFIGLGSGLSWLAWGVGTPVIMISGFSAPYTEFACDHRIDAPKDKCRHCFNKFKFDNTDWNWCPSNDKKEQYECTKYIEPQEILRAIEDIKNKDEE